MFQTEHEFTLPFGYVDDDGNLHRDGVMRLATAGDEILPLKDPRVQANQAYLVIILLARVVTRLGSVPQVTPKLIEGCMLPISRICRRSTTASIVTTRPALRPVLNARIASRRS